MKKIEIYNGPSTLGLLGVAFIVLKLLNIIEWSWWWVLAPFWIPLALIAMILIITGIIISGILIIVIYVENVKQKRSKA